MQDIVATPSLLFLIGTGVAILLLLFCSAIFSGSETALTTASRGKLHNMAGRGDKAAGRALDLTEDKERLIGAILLGNNLVNILATSLATMFFTVVLGDGGVAAATLVMTALVLIFSEVLPKTYAIANAEPLARRVSGFMRIVVMVASPVVAVVQVIVRQILRLMGVRPEDARPFAAHEEIADAITLHHFEGGMEKADRDRLFGALDLAHRSVEEVMTHRRDVQMIDIAKPSLEVIAEALASPHTRLPIYHTDADQIIGILHAKDLARAVQKAVLEGGVEALQALDIASIAMEAQYVLEVTHLDDQMHTFLRQKTHAAIVLDEYGAVRGLITLEDIMEEIVGDITDEHDPAPAAQYATNEDGSIDVEGDVTIRALNRSLNWNLPEEDAVTLAGLVINKAHDIPHAGEAFIIAGYRFEVLEREANRLVRLRIRTE
ncbi:HlyC/CorC family transporter [Falsirhodobacter deserti]|uniref:HlyC/CorC family transporter n=1 Tax=Falsirhodobacter deserti TaxID=1365611 RepID=UPI000FE43E24|nr:CNNM domain-containing protein [Falsirhodobacter deserti]